MKAFASLTRIRTALASKSSRVAQIGSAASLALLSSMAHAQAAPTADLSGLTALMQSFVTFMTGPFGKAAVVISIIVAFVTWIFAPREGIFGPVLRVVVAGIAVMNAAIFVTGLGAAGTLTL
jgi:type IV secretory pathway VirB2 component (pilin)